MARPIELTPELIDGITSLIRAGNIPVRAAQAKGVPRSTWYSWLARGRVAAGRRHDGVAVPEPEQIFVDLVDTIERAESESQVIAVNYLMKAVPTAPNAAIAWLERRFPREWQRSERHEVSGPDGGPVQVEDFRLRLAERADQLAARLLGPLAPAPDADPAKEEETP